MHTTGIPECDALIDIKLVGNIIPRTWYQTIVKDNLKNPKPYRLAIEILGEIVSWYKPKPIKDEKTGKTIGYEKNFYDDILQYSYKQMCDRLGCSHDQAKDAVVFLEKKGVIKRDFRKVLAYGNYTKAMYVVLNIDRLTELTHPAEGKKGNSQNAPSPLGEKDDGQKAPSPLGEKDDGQKAPSPLGEKDDGQNAPSPLGKKGDGQKAPSPLGEKDGGQKTHSTSEKKAGEGKILPTPLRKNETSPHEDINGGMGKSTHITYTPFPHSTLSSAENPSVNPSAEETEGTSVACEERVAEMPKATLQIPLTFCCERKSMQSAIRAATEYDFRMMHGFGLDVQAGHAAEEPKTDAYRLVTDCMVDMSCTSGTQVYGDGMATTENVVAEINRILALDHGSLTDFAEYVCDAYLAAKAETVIEHPRAYIKAVLWDKLRSYPQECDDV